MLEAALPQNEEERLHLLYYLNILDTPLEERFERITRLVCNILDVPIAAISLIDEDRQWFKSIQGLSATETPRKIAFCAHAILGNELLIVNDATTDERFADNPLVSGDPSIRFYAGQPLSLSTDIRMGTLCAIDNKPRQLSEREAAIMRDLGKIVEAELELLFVLNTQNEMLNGMETILVEARVDPLTRLWNRQGMLDIIQRDWDSSLKRKTPFTLACVSMEPPSGSTADTDAQVMVVVESARRLLRDLRPEDTVARWSDTHFMIALPDYGLAELSRIMNAIKQEVERIPVATKSAPVSLLMRAGVVSVIPTPAVSMEELIRQAEDEWKKTKPTIHSAISVRAV